LIAFTVVVIIRLEREFFTLICSLILPELKATQAAIVQLSVPLLVTLAGALLLNEVITLRIILASLAILTGTILVLSFKPRH